MQTLRASSARVSVRPQASLKPVVQRVAQVAVTGLASFAVALSAHADANIKAGADGGGLVFDPATVTIKAGETVTWTNNAGFPHNIVFDEDAVPGGVNVESISREDYLNAPGEKYSVKLTAAGSYSYYCEPHQGAGMVGKIIVQ